MCIRDSSYADYLEQIAELARKVNEGKSEDTPDELKTVAQRALYNNLGERVDLALAIDAAVHAVKRDDFRGNLAKEREIKAEIYKQLLAYKDETGDDLAQEPPEPYGLENKVEAIFKIILEQKEY